MINSTTSKTLLSDLVMVRRLDVFPALPVLDGLRQRRGMIELGARNSCEHQRLTFRSNFGEYVVQVEGRGHFCGLQAPRCTLNAHPPAGTVLHASM